MGYCLDTHVPWLIVDPCGFPKYVLSDVARRFVDLINESRGRQDLGNEWVRIEGNGARRSSRSSAVKSISPDCAAISADSG